MTSKQADRIALFQYEWPLQVHTINLASKLAGGGHHVDLFLKDCGTGFVNLADLQKNGKITVHDVSRALPWIFRRIIRYFVDQTGWLKRLLPLVAPYALSKARSILRKNNYRCFIGIEKKGLIWAGRLAEVMQVPSLYYSLELYLEDVGAFADDKMFTVLRQEEIKYHRASRATIIQDKMRADTLLRRNGIEHTDVLFLPVSLAEKENRRTTLWLYDRNGIPRDHKLILYFGLISGDRRCFEVANVARLLHEHRLVVFHGFGPPKDISQLRDRKKYPNIVLSLSHVAQDEIKDVISSAAIGLVLYENGCDNDRLTAFSSEKIALYLQSGVPIIAFDMGNYRLLTDTFRCGELITEVAELPDAVEKILNDYDRYREQAFAAYRKFYRYDDYVPAIREYLNAL